MSVKNVTYEIIIGKLDEVDEFYATIGGIVTAASYDPEDLGQYLSWSNFSLKNSLINPQRAVSKITIVTSNLYNAQKNNPSFATAIDNMLNFMATLNGRPINVYVTYTLINSTVSQSERKQIYAGYICRESDIINSKGGLRIELNCKTLISQLDKISSNASFQEATQTYGNAFTTVVSNQLSTAAFEELIFNQTLLTNSTLNITNGDAASLPNNLWAFLVPNKSRFKAINELLIPYSRIFYQEEDGTLTIRPLFYDYYADEIYSIDVQDNYSQNWIDYNDSRNSAELPNRIDVTFGVESPIPLFGMENTSIEAFASAPYIDSNNQIASLGQSLSYTDIYSTATRLYNSGVFIMPQMRNLDLDNSLVYNQNGLLNAVFAMYANNGLANSVVNISNNSAYNTIPQLYAQLYLAEANVDQYNAVISYDYMQVINADSPLGKLISIDNASKLDYPVNLVTDTTLNVDGRNGSIYIIQTSPLLSITGCWFSAGNA